MAAMSFHMNLSMKLLTLCSLLLCASGRPYEAIAQTRTSLLDHFTGKTQTPFPFELLNLANSEPVTITKLAPELRKESKRKRVVWGPYYFPPAKTAPPDPNKEHSHAGGNSTNDSGNETSLLNQILMKGGVKMDPSSSLVFARVTGVCHDCTILRGSIYISDEDGNRLDMNQGAYLHHILLVNPTKWGTRAGLPFYSCETWNPFQKLNLAVTPPLILSAGVEQPNFYFTSPDGSFNSGHYVRAFDQIVFEAEAINYNKEAKNWHVGFDYEYIEGRPKGLQDVSAAFFNVAGCAGLDINEASFYGPPGVKKFSSTGPPFRVRHDGTILHTVGHLHDGGDSIEMKVNDKSVCLAHAGYGKSLEGEGLMIQNMTDCPREIKVKAGDVITVTANYDTDKHPLRTTGGGKQVEAMGLFETLFAAKADD